MLAAEEKRLIDSYLAWLREGYSAEQVGATTRLTTPFLDPHSDELQIYVQPVEGGGLVLSDDGYTLDDLKDSGFEPNTDKRSAHVAQIVNGFGVKLEEGVLTVSATPQNFPQKKHNLLQAMLAVHDLSVMGQAQVLQFFKEDVAAFLDLREVAYFRGFKLAGRSGFDHLFDFGFPKRAGRPEVVMQAINGLSRDLATSTAFAVNDVRLQRGRDEVRAFAMINDRDGRPADDHLDALRIYDIKPFFWAERESLVSELTKN